uniref:Uncharacterized protein n=1 Tax=Anguilla anguilla TaxID=7936 RepID=A0A0E9T8M7_ANGAN
MSLILHITSTSSCISAGAHYPHFLLHFCWARLLLRATL